MSNIVKKPAPIIFGCEGEVLTKYESYFFSQVQPTGFILFKRNCKNPKQVKKLIAELKTLSNHNALILIDQEGGKVARLTPPHWQSHQAASYYGELYCQNKETALEKIFADAKKIAQELFELGINVNCFPVLDIPAKDAHEVIGSRAYGSEAKQVIELGSTAAEGLKAGGVLPVIKHLPGHGRAKQDSHKSLPIIATTRTQLSQKDFLPFQALKDEMLGMTAHIVFSDLDENNPVTFSKRIIDKILRSQIGFNGLLLSDDIGMDALKGGLAQRAQRALEAGCDIVLHCSGDLSEMVKITERLQSMTDNALVRLDKVLGATKC